MLVIEQNGKEFTATVKTPLRTHVNTFTIGKETTMTTMDGKKLKVSCLLRDYIQNLMKFSSKHYQAVLCWLYCFILYL